MSYMLARLLKNNHFQYVLTLYVGIEVPKRALDEKRSIRNENRHEEISFDTRINVLNLMVELRAI